MFEILTKMICNIHKPKALLLLKSDVYVICCLHISIELKLDMFALKLVTIYLIKDLFPYDPVFIPNC